MNIAGSGDNGKKSQFLAWGGGAPIQASPRLENSCSADRVEFLHSEAAGDDGDGKAQTRGGLVSEIGD